MDFKTFRAIMQKRAASVMTPEAQQAAAGGGQPPMDPSMMGGAPGGMPPDAGGGQPPMDPAMAQGGPPPQGPQGGEIPPEIIQDQGFIQFLAEMAGIMFDPQSGTFMDSQGQPVPAEAVMQLYQEYQMQMQQGGGGQPPMDPSMAQGGDPNAMPPDAGGGQPPMDPAMMGGDPNAMPPEAGGQPPMDPAMMGGDPNAMPPEGGGQPPMDPSMMGGMPPEGGEQPPPVPDAVMDQIVSAVMSGVETMLQQYTERMEAKFAELTDKLDALVDISAQRDATDDERSKDDRDHISALRKEMENELAPVKQASVKSTDKKRKPLNIFDIINNKP